MRERAVVLGQLVLCGPKRVLLDLDGPEQIVVQLVADLLQAGFGARRIDALDAAAAPGPAVARQVAVPVADGQEIVEDAGLVRRRARDVAAHHGQHHPGHRLVWEHGITRARHSGFA